MTARTTSDNRLFPIGELTRRTGTTKRVVEHAEARGLLRPAGRTLLGHKLYTPEDAETLRLIVWLYRLGLSAARIKALFFEPDERVAALLAEHHDWLRRQSREAMQRLEKFEREKPAVAHQLAIHRQQRGTGGASHSASPASSRPRRAIQPAA